MKKILKASAGTGKTYRLSLEYVAALLHGEDFTEIVVMTFTRKATAEIRERIIEHIEDILDKGRKSNVFKSLQKIYENIELKSLILKNTYTEMLQNKDRIHIYTIDSFINQIFQQAVTPYLNIYAYDIIEDDKNTEVIEEVFKKLIDNPDDFAIMENFLMQNTERDIENYIKLIDKLLKNRWKFLLINHQKRTKRNTGNLAITLDRCINILKEIAEVKGKEFSDHYFIKSFRNFLPEYCNLHNSKAKKNIIIKNYKRFFKKTFWNGRKTMGKKVNKLKKELETNYQIFRESLSNYFFNEEIIPYEEEVFNFCQKIFSIYDQIKLKEKSFTHSDISNYTYKYLHRKDLELLNGNTVSDYFFDLIGTKVKSLFIDEFQDTSILQWKILKPLLDKCQNIITVGDEKQSIYGWRGGEKKLFADLENIINGESETLRTCYRSEKEILDFINSFFQNLEIDWQYRSVSNLSNKSDGYVEILLGGNRATINTDTRSYQKKSEEEQAEIIKLNNTINKNLKSEIARTIKYKLSNNGDIGILARNNNDLTEIAAELEKENIPYMLESKDCLIEHEAIKPLYSLLNYLTFNDYFQLLIFLRSDLVGVNNQCLKFLLRNKNKVQGYIHNGNPEFEFNNIQETLSKIRKLKQLNYSNLIYFIIEKSGILKLYRENSSALKNIYYFYEKMNEFTCLKDLMNYLEEYRDSEKMKQVGIRENNAVKLMTIHKAKGLSFETEFFYWKPDSGGNNCSGQLEIYISFDEKFQGVKQYLLTNSKYEKTFQYLGINFAKKQAKKRMIEEINNVYVALTRPKKNLFFYIESPRQLKLDKNDRCWSGSSYEFYENAILNSTGVFNLRGLTEKIKKGKLSRSNKDERIISSIPDLKDYFKPAEVPKEKILEINKNKDLNMDMAKEINRIEGLAIHYYLEFIKYNTPEEKKYARSMVLARYGNILGPDRTNKIINRVNFFINQQLKYFDYRWKVFTEYELKNEDRCYRIDRLIMDNKNKEVIIIDYKTGETKDQAQLDRYKEIIEEKTAGKYKVKTEFLQV